MAEDITINSLDTAQSGQIYFWAMGNRPAH